MMFYMLTWPHGCVLLLHCVSKKRRKLIKKSKTGRKLQHTNSILEYLGYFCQNVIKIDPYKFELYRFKVGAFFET